MRFLISLIKRGRTLFLFILLEIIALSLIVNNRTYQRSSFINSTNSVTGTLLKHINNYSQYLDLNIENENLVNENAQLQNLLDKSRVFQSYGADTIGDSTHSIRYTSLPARVINSSFLKRNNYITIDKGSKSGLAKGMGVYGPQGAVGIVNGISTNFASIIPIINPNLTLTGKLKDQGYFGPLKWDGENFRYAYLEDIPKYADINHGDTLITDSRSIVFPEGIFIGTVVSKEIQDDQNFFRVKIHLGTDFSKIEHLYIIKDKLKAEMDSLAM